MERYSLHSRGGKWLTSQRFHELETAKAWGLTPSQWDSLDESDRCQMLAFETTVGEMRSYEDYLEDERQVRSKAQQAMKGK